MDRTPASLTALAAALLAAGLMGVSCSKSPTEPPLGPTVHRTVTLVVRDSLGVPAPGLGVQWIAQSDSAGIATVVLGTTDAQGASVAVLSEGAWIVSAQADPPTGWVTGAGFQVAGRQRAAADTELVSVTLHTGSRASGTTLLAGRTDESGTIVSSGSGAIAVTDSSGAWALDHLPLGKWSLTLYHVGFQLGTSMVTVSAPGSRIVAPIVTLTP